LAGFKWVYSTKPIGFLMYPGVLTLRETEQLLQEIHVTLRISSNEFTWHTRLLQFSSFQSYLSVAIQLN